VNPAAQALVWWRWQSLLSSTAAGRRQKVVAHLRSLGGDDALVVFCGRREVLLFHRRERDARGESI
jgi:hypothetical protein